VEPWQKLAQIYFKSHDYPNAIVSAKKVTALKQDDELANSIISVSGLRLSARALGVLRRTNQLDGPVKSEATSLAKVLRSNLGVEEIVPTTEQKQVKKNKVVKRRVVRKKRVRRTEKNKPAVSNSADPFASLK